MVGVTDGLGVGLVLGVSEGVEVISTVGVNVAASVGDDVASTVGSGVEDNSGVGMSVLVGEGRGSVAVSAIAVGVSVCVLVTSVGVSVGFLACTGNGVAKASVGINAFSKITAITNTRITISVLGLSANISHPPEIVCKQKLTPDCIYWHGQLRNLTKVTGSACENYLKTTFDYFTEGETVQYGKSACCSFHPRSHTCFL